MDHCLRCAFARRTLGSGGSIGDQQTSMSHEEADIPERKGTSLSWPAMLWLVLLAIAIASGVAYLMISPYFHRPVP